MQLRACQASPCITHHAVGYHQVLALIWDPSLVQRLDLALRVQRAGHLSSARSYSLEGEESVQYIVLAGGTAPNWQQVLL